MTHQRAYAREREYLRCATSGGDIAEHLPRLRSLAASCEYVTEMGTRGANGSTVAFLAAQPARLVCYDIEDCPGLARLRPNVGRTELLFVQADVLAVDIEPTDLLFIDTRHTYAQLSEELKRHSGAARKWIVLHDTVTFGERGEDGSEGLWPAVEEFVARGRWKLYEHHTNNNGLTVLEPR